MVTKNNIKQTTKKMEEKLILTRYDELREKLENDMSPQEKYDFEQKKKLDDLLELYVNSDNSIRELFRHIIKKDYD